MEEQGDQQKSHSNLDEAPIEADPNHAQVAEPATLGGQGYIGIWLFERKDQRKHNAHHHQGEDDTKPFAINPDGKSGTDQRPGQSQ